MMSCSFCGKREDQVHRLVAGPGVYICGGCLEVSMQILTVSGTDQGVTAFTVLARRPDGTVERLEHGPLPQADGAQRRWLRQCKGCGAWNVGESLTACLDCSTAL